MRTNRAVPRLKSVRQRIDVPGQIYVPGQVEVPRRRVPIQERMNSPLENRPGRRVRIQERMNSPLENRKVRLRGLGGLAA